MTGRDFAFWLHGYLEVVAGEAGLTPVQVSVIRNRVSRITGDTLTVDTHEVGRLRAMLTQVLLQATPEPVGQPDMWELWGDAAEILGDNPDQYRWKKK